MEYYQLEIKEVFNKLKTSEKGLSEKEAKKRLEQYGYNELKEKKRASLFSMFLKQFKNILVIILLAAILVSIFIGEFVDASVIFIIVILNAILGVVQEYRTEKSIDALKKLQEAKTIVIRDGKKKEIVAKDIVPGDIIAIEEGSKITADARLIDAIELRVDESSLTGESTPVEKKITKVSKAAIAEQKDMVFSGTNVLRGRGKAIITNTGMNTEIGRIAELIEEAEEKQTPLQKKLDSFGKKLGIAILIICALIFIIDLWREGNYSLAAITDTFLVAVSLAVAAIPEGLPAIVTISLALGVKRMVKRNALVRKLPTIETLGSTTTICSDKTGTLTVNKMTVREVFVDDKFIKVTGEGYDIKGDFFIDNKKLDVKNIELLLKIGAYCNDAELGDGFVGDPTEIALLVVAKKADINLIGKRISEEPFQSEKKYMAVTYDINGKKYSYYKGASEVILNKCKYTLKNGRMIILDDKEKKRLLKINDDMANRALRVLAMAYTDDDKLIFVGFTGMIDPPRKEVKEAIRKCQEAGIRAVMITGDHILTAKAIAKEIGLNGEAITGAEIETKNEAELRKIVKKISIFARVNPEHKVKILLALKKEKNIVAMTGDGVNDAPALKNADIGIAMGIIGTDVSREASDMILTDDNFASIVNAVEEGRGIYDNIKKFIAYLLSSNLGEVLIIFFALVLNLPLPLVAVQLLWLNLVTDGLPAVALGVDPAKKDIMKDKPRKSDENILTKRLSFNIIGMGILIAFATLFLFREHLPNVDEARTAAFTGLVIFELVRLYVIRSEYRLGIFSNWMLIVAVLSSIILQLIVVYVPVLNIAFKTVPLGLGEWYTIAVASGGLIIANIILRFISNRMFDE